MNVMVLDGNQRSALAVVRSLGRKGVSISVGEDVHPCLASSSRYCTDSFAYGCLKSEPDSFIDTLQKKIESSGKAVLLPMTDVTLGEVLDRREVLGKDVVLPFPGLPSYNGVSDKVNLLKVAMSLSIPIPKTLFSCDYADLPSMIGEAKKMGFPLVIKPARSRFRTEIGWVDGEVMYAENDESLNNILGSEPFRSHPFLIQERIEGPGVGIFLLMSDGEVIARFAHKRIREKPPSGGVSTICESIQPPEMAYEYAVKLLAHFEWRGVAMVEFKLDRMDDSPKLMEVNGRFWGSLQLAIESGVDFPYLLYRLALGDIQNGPKRYRAGVKSRWELGDLDHLLIRLSRGNPNNRYLPRDAPSKGNVVKEFLFDFFRPSVRHEVFSSRDPGPFWFELKEYAKSLRI